MCTITNHQFLCVYLVSLFSKAAIYDIGLETVCEKCLSDCVSITYTAQLESQIPIDVEYQDQIIENMKLR